MMKRFERESRLIAEYEWRLLVNRTGIQYFTSDNPVIKDNTYHRTLIRLLRENQFSSGLGYLSKGIEFYIPISSNLCILLADLQPLFQYIKQNMTIWYILADKIKKIIGPKIYTEKANVIYLNEHITAFANKYILSEFKDFCIAQEFLERNLESRSPNRRRWKVK